MGKTIDAAGGLPYFRAFFEELRRLGYVEGRNLAVARYSAEGRNERHAEIAREVVRTKPDVVVTVGSGLVLSFKAASSTIPVVAMTGDPVVRRRELGPAGKKLYRFHTT